MILAMNAYPPEILARLQRELLSILDEIAAVCERHGIEWFLTGGSSLGAVRHKGMIPWDDDIDIGMVRPEYERFLEVAADELPNTLAVLEPRYTPNYAPMFAKICRRGTRFYTQETIDAGLEMGIAIDVFPHDYISSNPAVRKRQYRGAVRTTQASYLLHSPSVSRNFTGAAAVVLPPAFKVAHFVLKHTTNEQALRKRFANAIHLDENEPVDGLTAFGHPYFKSLPIDLFVPPRECEFDGRRAFIPNQCDLYLDDHFGSNWNELPPVEKRKTHAPLILDFGDGINALADNAQSPA